MTSLLKFRILTSLLMKVACELPQPMGKTKFSSTAKKQNKFCLIGKKSLFNFSGAGKFCFAHMLRQLNGDAKGDVSCLQSKKKAITRN